MRNLHTYKLKLTALSPIHIGTGEVYEPTSFVIDGGNLYEFDEMLFYQNLSELDKAALNSKLDNWMEIISFYKTKANQAKIVARNIVQVTKKVSDIYNGKTLNQFQIAKTQTNPNTNRAIISGSSIKGMLNTVLQIYSPKVRENEPRQNLIVSDALLISGGSEIGRSTRIYKRDKKQSKKGNAIPQLLEIVKAGSTFLLIIRSELSFDQLISKMQNYHKDRKDSRFKSTKNSFVARVGKYSGQEYMVDRVPNKSPITQTVYEDSDSFGWLNFELISDEEAEKYLQDIKTQEANYYKELESRQKEVLEKIAKKREEQEAKRVEVEAEKAKEEAAKQAEIEAEKTRVASLSPLEQSIESLPNPANMPQTTLILKAIEDGLLSEFGAEAVEYLISLMKQAGEWKEITQAKNPAKDKEFQKTARVLKLREQFGV